MIKDKGTWRAQTGWGESTSVYALGKVSQVLDFLAQPLPGPECLCSVSRALQPIQTHPLLCTWGALTHADLLLAVYLGCSDPSRLEVVISPSSVSPMLELQACA